MKKFNTKESAKYLTDQLGVKTSPITLEIYRSKGRGPAYRKIMNRVLYDQEDLVSWAQGVRVSTSDSG